MSRPTETRSLKFGGAETTTVDDVTSDALQTWGSKVAVQVALTGDGAVAANVRIKVSVDPELFGWITAATLTLSGNDAVTDGRMIDAAWKYIAVEVVDGTLSGTDATVRAAASGWAA